MKRAYHENGILKHANMKEIDIWILSEKARSVAEVSSFDITQDTDEEDLYYIADNSGQDFRKAGTLEDLNKELEDYAE